MLRVIAHGLAHNKSSGKTFGDPAESGGGGQAIRSSLSGGSSTLAIGKVLLDTTRRLFGLMRYTAATCHEVVLDAPAGLVGNDTSSRPPALGGNFECVRVGLRLSGCASICLNLGRRIVVSSHWSDFAAMWMDS